MWSLVILVELCLLILKGVQKKHVVHFKINCSLNNNDNIIDNSIYFSVIHINFAINFYLLKDFIFSLF